MRREKQEENIYTVDHRLWPGVMDDTVSTWWLMANDVTSFWFLFIPRDLKNIKIQQSINPSEM